MRSGALACLGKNRTMAKRGKQKSQRSGRHRGGLKSKGKRDEAEAARVESLGPSAVFVAELERVQDCSDMLGKAGLMSTEKMFSFELDGTSSSAAQEDGDVRMYSKKNHHRRMEMEGLPSLPPPPQKDPLSIRWRPPVPSPLLAEMVPRR